MILLQAFKEQIKLVLLEVEVGQLSQDHQQVIQVVLVEEELIIQREQVMLVDTLPQKEMTEETVLDHQQLSAEEAEEHLRQVVEKQQVMQLQVQYQVHQLIRQVDQAELQEEEMEVEVQEIQVLVVVKEVAQLQIIQEVQVEQVRMVLQQVDQEEQELFI
jgi:hypothetical protein